MVLSSDDPKWLLVKSVVSGTLELILFCACSEGVFYSFCVLGRIFHSHSLVYGIPGGQLQED